jgi:Bacterial extracellular solute-binding protein, family 7
MPNVTLETSVNRTLATLPLSCIALAASNAIAADPINEHSLKFGYSVQEAHPLGKGATKFAELVASKSGGKIKIKNYPAAQLGSEVQLISAAQGGVQEMVGVSSAPLVGIVKDFALFDLPFLFANEKEVDAVVDGPVGAQLYDKLASKGLVGLCFWENGFRHVTNSKRPITKAEDLKGLKIRTMQNPVYVDLFNTLGANAVPMAWPEVYGALAIMTVIAGPLGFGSFAPVFLLTVFGSIAAGVGVALAMRPLTTRLNDVPIALIVQFSTTFGVWIAAEAIGLSGILTLVAFAMTAARRGGPQMPARMRVPISRCGKRWSSSSTRSRSC